MGPNISGQTLENTYLNETNFPVVKNNYVIISGCSGGGKSTLLSDLASRGYSIVLEPGRQIVKEQTAINGNSLPWINLEKFLDLALSRYLFQFNSQNEQQQLVFFDRGIIDAVQLGSPQPEYFQNAAKNFRYNRLVFLFHLGKRFLQAIQNESIVLSPQKRSSTNFLSSTRILVMRPFLFQKFPLKKELISSSQS